jgi:hypothetical protein
MIGLMSLKKNWYKNYGMGDSLCTDCGWVVGVVGAGHVTMALYYHSLHKNIFFSNMLYYHEWDHLASSFVNLSSQDYVKSASLFSC